MPKKRSAGIAGAVALAAVAAVLVNLVIGSLARAVTSAPADFAALEPVSFVPLTVVGVVAGAVGWAVVRRRVARAATLLRRLVPVAVVASFVPDLVLYATSSADTVAVLALMVMHVVVATAGVLAYARVLPVTDEPVTVPATGSTASAGGA